MYDVVCPVCQRMIEIPSRAVESKGAHKCPKCWTWLKVVDSHPLRLEEGAEDMAVVSAPTRSRAPEDGIEEDEEQ
jgi:uncharacterized paraquat-inducible protein A